MIMKIDNENDNESDNENDKNNNNKNDKNNNNEIDNEKLIKVMIRTIIMKIECIGVIVRLVSRRGGSLNSS